MTARLERCFGPELGKNWQCPYCSAHQVLLETRYDSSQHKIGADASIHGETALHYEVRVCANQDCRKMLLTLRLAKRQDINDGLGTFKLGEAVKEWTLMPSPLADKNLPGDIRIPELVRENYAQAHRFKELSPAASALHARRALSGMLHDFCGITQERLADQIERLRALVGRGKAPQWANGLEDIDLVRGNGNIAKHLCAAPDQMVEVDAGEADRLLGLLDQLAQDWYGARAQREKRGMPMRAGATHAKQRWL